MSAETIEWSDLFSRIVTETVTALVEALEPETTIVTYCDDDGDDGTTSWG